MVQGPNAAGARSQINIERHVIAPSVSSNDECALISRIVETMSSVGHMVGDINPCVHREQVVKLLVSPLEALCRSQGDIRGNIDSGVRDWGSGGRISGQ